MLKIVPNESVDAVLSSKFPTVVSGAKIGAHAKTLSFSTPPLLKQLPKTQKECISRESNTGPVDGNDGFYH